MNRFVYDSDLLHERVKSELALTHFIPLVSSYTPEKTGGFLIILKSIERDQWHSFFFIFFIFSFFLITKFTRFTTKYKNKIIIITICVRKYVIDDSNKIFLV